MSGPLPGYRDDPLVFVREGLKVSLAPMQVDALRRLMGGDQLVREILGRRVRRCIAARVHSFAGCARCGITSRAPIWPLTDVQDKRR